jgi:hypothetical protein
MVPSTSWEDTNQTPKSYSNHTSSEGTAASIGIIAYRDLLFFINPPSFIDYALPKVLLLISSIIQGLVNIW